MRSSRPARRAAVGLVVGAALMSAAPARAELVYFANGRSMSVKNLREAGDSLVLVLRSGGEIICDRTIVARVEPDEVPYPEPQAASTNSLGRSVEPYANIIEAVAAEQGLSPRMVKLVKAVIQVESAYRETRAIAQGRDGADAADAGDGAAVRGGQSVRPRANIEAGIKHLKTLLRPFPLPLALAAYNAGEAAVQRFGGMPPYAETRDYVARVLRTSDG